MSTFEKEEKRRTTTYDIKIIKWLFNFLDNYKRYFALSLFFMVLVALLEVSIPYLTKKAVDSYIYPSWIKISLNDSKAEKEFNNLNNLHSEYSIKINNSTFILDLSKLKRSEKQDLKESTLFSDEKYIVIDSRNYEPGVKNKLSAIIKKNPNKFETTEEFHLIKYEDLKSFPKKEVSILRLEQINKLKVLVVYIFLSLLGIFIFTSTFTYLLYYSGHNIMHLIRQKTFNHILKLPQSYFDKNPVGRISTRVTNDVNSINEMYTSVMVQFIKDIIVIIAVLIILFYLNVKLTLIIIALTVFLGIVAALFRMRLKTVFREIRMTIGKLNAFVQESIQGIVILKLYGKEKRNFERFININRENYKANMDQLWTYVMFRPFIEYISIMGSGLIIWYGGFSVINQNLTLGSLIAYLYYVRMIFKPIQELSEKYNIFQSAAAASENLYDIMQEEIEESGNIIPDKTQGIIEFQDVWFSYNNKDWVLKNVSFIIRPGETAALVGLTGSGKTTIVNLLLKFYKIQKGTIYFNGVDINKLNTDYIRESITAIFQDLFLFGKNISEEEIDYEKIEKNYGIKYDSNSMKKLSAGENQIVSITKALEKDCYLLVMDEATSNIDAEIEKTIQSVIKKDTKSATKLIIAHRLSNVRNADKIIVIHKGEIVEQGNHSELIDNKNIYYRLHNFQKEIHSIKPSTN